MDAHGRLRAGQATAARRGRMDLTQEELASKAGVSARTIGDLESGKRWPIARNRTRIELALEWPDGEIARKAQEPAPETPLIRPGLYRELVREVGDDDAAAVLDFLRRRRSGP